ncbi:MAG: cysteine--tRNA ligase [Actinomycetota bacterium]
MIRVYDTLRRKVVPLESRDEGRVAMYVCGPTVYGYTHIGNARTFVWYDFLRRYLIYRGFDVTFVMNYTDVDDKIIERSKIEGIPPEGVAKKYAAAFEQDMAALGFSGPDVLSLATDHIDDMIKAIERLIEKGAGYEVGGDVFFSVESFEGYGKLSKRSIEEMRSGERIEPHPGKRHPVDFALWKAAKEGEPSWSSPWGPGRPGWHIECSVMATKYLGMGFDLHGGGLDLVFPHHENEIAQAEAVAENETFVRTWVHSGLVQMEAEKMSKSLGNIVLAREAVENYPGEVVRYWCLAGSLRSQPTFSEETLQDAANSYDRWKTLVEASAHLLGEDMLSPPKAARRPLDEPIEDVPGGPYLQRFVDAMDDDFNSAEAFAVVHELVRDGNKCLEGAQRENEADRAVLVELLAAFLELTSLLGFRFAPEETTSALTSGLIEYLLQLREEARAEEAFARADAIRARLQGLGVAVEDTPAGPRWRLHGGP